MSYGQAQMAVEYEESAKVPYDEKKPKKLGFFKRWLLNSVKDAVQTDRQYNSSTQINDLPRNIAKGHYEQLESQPMHMKIYRANGGTIVETTVIDRQKDRHSSQLHIIGHDTDLGQGLAKIITLESLRG